jgi:hypothetical protein
MNLSQLISHAKENKGKGFPTLTSTRIHTNEDWYNTSFLVDVTVRGVATFLLTSMFSSSSSYVAKVSDKYSEVEVSSSLLVDANVDDPSSSAMLLCGIAMVRTLLLCAFAFTVLSSQIWVDLFDFFLVHIMFEFPLLQYAPSTKNLHPRL